MMSHLDRGVIVRDLAVNARRVQADIVSDVSFSVRPGETMGIVGESGSGKTTVAHALLGYSRPGTHIVRGAVVVDGVDLLTLSAKALRAVRGNTIAFVPQDPAVGLSPGMRIGAQIEETIRAHDPALRDVAARVSEALTAAQLPSVGVFQRRFPFELSGGQQQRVAIALALSCDPAVIVMDEPTTGLDVTTQTRLLEVITSLSQSREVAVVYVSHDLAVVRNLATHIAVMYGGRILESGRSDDVFSEPWHPYTRRLLEAAPRVRGDARLPRGIPGSAVEPQDRPAGCPFAPRCDLAMDMCHDKMPPVDYADGRSVRCWRWTEVRASNAPTARIRGVFDEKSRDSTTRELLRIEDLTATYRSSRLLVRNVRTSPAVDRVRFAVNAGSCVAIVGESGSGKSTLLRCIAGLHTPDSGDIIFNSESLPNTPRARELGVRRRIQLIPQNPDASLNPRHSVGTIIGRPLQQFFRLKPSARRKRVEELLEKVQLQAGMTSRLPRELSGGEKQRVAIARALAAEPDLLLCDEITASLDVAVQASILELVHYLGVSLDTAIVFVSHDLAVVRAISESVIVMHDGRICEYASTQSIFSHATDEYTQTLLAASPDFRPEDYPREPSEAATAGVLPQSGAAT